MPVPADDEQVVLVARLEQSPRRRRIVDLLSGHVYVSLGGQRESVREREICSRGRQRAWSRSRLRLPGDGHEVDHAAAGRKRDCLARGLLRPPRVIDAAEDATEGRAARRWRVRLSRRGSGHGLHSGGRSRAIHPSSSAILTGDYGPCTGSPPDDAPRIRRFDRVMTTKRVHIRNGARPGDWIAVHQIGGGAPRRGQVLEVIGRPGHERYRVRWDEQHESIYFPSEATSIERPARQRRSRPSARRSR